MKKSLVIAFYFVVCGGLTSCGSFGQGLLAGLASYGNPYGYSGYSGYSGASAGTGNMDYLLDPRYAAAQTMAQQNQLNQLNEALINQSVNTVMSQEENAYQEFCRYNKKPDGSNYSKYEWRAMVGEAYAKTNNNSGSSYSSGSSYNSSSSSSRSSSSSSRRTCTKLTANDIAHCNGNGICSKCNGKKWYRDSAFGIDNLVDPCNICHGSGKCPSCHGTGKR